MTPGESKWVKEEIEAAKDALRAEVVDALRTGGRVSHEAYCAVIDMPYHTANDYKSVPSGLGLAADRLAKKEEPELPTMDDWSMAGAWGTPGYGGPWDRYRNLANLILSGEVEIVRRGHDRT